MELPTSLMDIGNVKGTAKPQRTVEEYPFRSSLEGHVITLSQHSGGEFMLEQYGTYQWYLEGHFGWKQWFQMLLWSRVLRLNITRKINPKNPNSFRGLRHYWRQAILPSERAHLSWMSTYIFYNIAKNVMILKNWAKIFMLTWTQVYKTHNYQLYY